MTSCPECESDLDIDVEEVEEGDVVACENITYRILLQQRRGRPARLDF